MKGQVYKVFGKPFVATALCVLYCALMILPGCKDHPVEVQEEYRVPTDLRNIIPLGVGHFWKYRLMKYRSEEPDTTFETVRVLDTLTIDDRAGFIIVGEPAHEDADGYYFETVDSSLYSRYVCIGCFRSGIQFRESSLAWFPVTFLRLPLHTGATWDRADWDTIPAWDMGSSTLLSVDSTLRVGETFFTHAIVVENISPSYSVLYAIVPGIGIVYQRYAYFDTWTVKELIEYNVE